MSVIYRYLKYGAREEKTCQSVVEALDEAIGDLETSTAAPLEIEENGKVVMDHSAICAEHRKGLDNDKTPVETPVGKCHNGAH